MNSGAALCGEAPAYLICLGQISGGTIIELLERLGAGFWRSSGCGAGRQKRLYRISSVSTETVLGGRLWISLTDLEPTLLMLNLC